MTKAGRFEDAEAVLLEALKKNPKDSEVLINLSVCATSLGKDASQYLKEIDQNHSFVRETREREAAFAKAASKYTV